MTLASLCRIFIFGITILVLVFDIAMAAFGTANDTISLQIFHLAGGDLVSFREKSFLVAIGYLLGHLIGRVDS